MSTPVVVRARVRLGPAVGDAVIHRAIKKLEIEASKIIGSEPRSSFVLIDRTGRYTMVMAQYKEKEPA